ncbi:HD-GYP domain-containing protein [Sporohalobacter salinus]|uniref:HD-GYP domain-containing protein n=1 Tax=Sporohalobacter salinus TaxID=1494606 RepID=UPI001960BD4A|nr:HD-GYP domain-containing protein [Sporohalobacter salinus]MBM7623006.1 HD-GYP domain-containing protein (c-di-GMP phosphodiesterase class II) [Sporohalobacter salinus]
MRKVLTEDLEAGMKVAKPLYLSDGTVLLNAGVILKDSYIEQLKERNIPAVFIIDENLPEVEVPEVISDQTKLQATQTLRECMNDISLGTKLNARKVKKAVNDIVDEITSKNHVVVHLNDIRAYDDYTFGHSVNVTSLAILTGMSMGYNKLELRDLGVGALLHDIGKITVDEGILLKPDSLTDEEFAEIQKHTRRGYEIIRDTEGISSCSAHVAFQHHERMNGSGYPRGLQGDEILEFAQIAAVVDVYDAVTCDRVYRDAFAPHEALELLEDMMQAELNHEIVQIFFENVAIYPIGTLVELNNGEIGIVVDVNKEDLSSPVIRLIKEDDEIEEIDLMHNEEIEIKEVITDSKRSEYIED